MKKIFPVICILFAALLCSCSQAQSDNTEGTQVFTAAPETQTAETEPQESSESELDEITANMSVEEKVGQLFFCRCPEVDAEQWVSDYHLGGYVLFGRDFDDKTADEVRTDIQSYQQNAKIPLLIGVDEEGGTVTRVSDNIALSDEMFLSPKEYYAAGGMDYALEAEGRKADLLLSLGINVNLAPVCDITSDPEAFMYDRSFSGDEALVSEFVSGTVELYGGKKLGAVLKHFPGYADCADTHTGIAYDERPYSDFTNRDFKPFEKAIGSGADCVLVAHTIVESMDPETPASLSDKVHQILREDLHFHGVIMTDDLTMEAITDYTGADEAAVAAVKAGNDLICCSNIETQYQAVLDAVNNEEIPILQIDNSVKRILRWKQKLGLM